MLPDDAKVKLIGYLGQDWFDTLGTWFESSDADHVMQEVFRRRLLTKVCPDPEKVFRAFKLCRKTSLKVIILGQDPYHTIRKGVKVADGLAFSSSDPTYKPPSLNYIFKEVENCFPNCFPSMESRTKYSLDDWAEQGVLLLNTVLTVNKAQPGSHQDVGWNSFIIRVLDELSKIPNLIWMLWGSDAKSYTPLITNASHFVLKARHPASEAYSEDENMNKGYLEQYHFRKANDYLGILNKTPIDWHGFNYIEEMYGRAAALKSF